MRADGHVKSSSLAAEAAQAAKLRAAAAEYTVCESLLCKILTPHQSILLLQHVAEITSNLQSGYSTVAYRCRYHAALVLDDKLNRSTLALKGCAIEVQAHLAEGLPDMPIEYGFACLTASSL